MARYVLTGGPGVGKTTVAELLSMRGYKTMPEVPRMIIEEEKAKDSNFHPWTDLFGFQEKVAKRQLRHEEEDYKDGMFLDRSIIDGFAYCAIGKIAPPDVIVQHARGRYDKIFLFEPLLEYMTDSVRFESREFGLEIHNEIKKAYEFFGYELISVPPLKPEDRVEFILTNITI